MHLSLAKSNASVNAAVGHEHIEHAMIHLDANTLKEIVEKNKRVATDLPAALERLGTMIHEGNPKAQITKQFAVVGGLLGEAVGARVDKAKAAAGSVQALVMAGVVVDEALEAYHEAFGVPESHDHDHSMKSTMKMNDTMAMGDHAMSDDHAMDSTKVTNKVAYDSAKSLATKASSMYVKLSKLVPKGTMKST